LVHLPWFLFSFYQSPPRLGWRPEQSSGTLLCEPVKLTTQPALLGPKGKYCPSLDCHESLIINKSDRWRKVTCVIKSPYLESLREAFLLLLLLESLNLDFPECNFFFPAREAIRQQKEIDKSSTNTL
jgi:hypothetical protein